MPKKDLLSGTMEAFDEVTDTALKNKQSRKKVTDDISSNFSNVRRTSKKRGSNNILSSLGTETVPFGGSTRYEDFHPGVDIANKIGTPIPSLSPGKVVDVRTGQGRKAEGFGNYAIVRDPQGNRVRYSHLNEVEVKEGQKISPGQPIGEMGTTGSTYSTTGGSGSHLDLRIKKAYDEYVSPYKYLNRYGLG